jgi:hypothetical protein
MDSQSESELVNLLMKRTKFLSGLFFLLISAQMAYTQEKVFPGADEKTPSKAQYFSWINNTNEGPTEKQTLINFAFFDWLKSTYGMQLDIYAFDAGALDGKNFYGSLNSARFKKQFPNGFDPLYKKATYLGMRLGIWGGPDGFGNTAEEEQERISQMVRLCKDYGFALFKFDAVCGPLRPEKEDAFVKMMIEARKYSPDLILLNHRLGLTKGLPYATTFLWGGAETYIDVVMNNNSTAPHHRQGALSRGLVPGLKRLTEDHGVCISSCLDYWDDDLVLQAFNRSLILSPEIYGNPWLLRDEEYPKLARIFNIHQKYKDILTSGMVLPAKAYGADAVSRGNDKTRLITLKNLTWTKQVRTLRLGNEIGLAKGEKVKLIRLHPDEEYLGTHQYNDAVQVNIEPFRSALFIATTEEYSDPVIAGARFQVIQNVPGKPILIDVLGNPGSTVSISVLDPWKYKKAGLTDLTAKKMTISGEQKITFTGTSLKNDTKRKLAGFSIIPVPKDAESLYEATVFAADNNALEVRSLMRSGKTDIPAVKQARDAFFEQDAFVERGVWDKNLFDGDLKTGFWESAKYRGAQKVKGGMFRLDLGKVTAVDELILKVPDIFSLQPLLPDEGNFVEVSKDLIKWKQLTYIAGTTMKIAVNDSVRYFRFVNQPQQLTEVEALYKGKQLDRSSWRASNLFAPANKMVATKAWKTSFKLEELTNHAYLSVALNGIHGIEGAYVAAKINGKYIGAPDRSVSYPSNTWEHSNAKLDQNYTYYIPLKKEYINQEIELFVFSYDAADADFKPEAWMWSTDADEKIRLELIPKTGSKY